MKQKNNFSIRNRKAAISRWNKIKQRISANLASMNKRQYVKYKSRLMGFLSGDGGVYVRKEKNGRLHHDIVFFPDHKSMVPLFVEAFKLLYLKKPKTKIMKNFYQVRVQSKNACDDLLKDGKFKTLEWNVPREFLFNKESKAEWLRAFFDCEGYVSKKRLQIQSVNKEGIYQIKTLLEDFRIESKIYTYKRKNRNWNINYILNINKKDSRQRFLKEIGFNHKIKLMKLKQQFPYAKVG